MGGGRGHQKWGNVPFFLFFFIALLGVIAIAGIEHVELMFP